MSQKTIQLMDESSSLLAIPKHQPQKVFRNILVCGKYTFKYITQMRRDKDCERIVELLNQNKEV